KNDQPKNNELVMYNALARFTFYPGESQHDSLESAGRIAIEVWCQLLLIKFHLFCKEAKKAA
ncbi:hypothetical protein, partial [Serratia marcescens]|uniref:hypothetical protein n=1 Tax=Serratia marcescens TaxID=615 RepID=UPI001BAEC14F